MSVRKVVLPSIIHHNFHEAFKEEDKETMTSNQQQGTPPPPTVQPTQQQQANSVPQQQQLMMNPFVGLSMMSNAPYFGMPPEAFAAVAAASMPNTNAPSQNPAVAQLPTLFPNPTQLPQPQFSSTAVAAATLPPIQSSQPTNPKRAADLTPEERAQQNRDRNREHARSTRLRKKAYVQKLRELVEGLHAERTEEVRRRRVAIQHLAELQSVRKTVIQSFLEYHGQYETDDRRWSTILENDFYLVQPVTPYRSFRRAEIEKVSNTCPCRTTHKWFYLDKPLLTKRQ